MLAEKLNKNAISIAIQVPQKAKVLY